MTRCSVGGENFWKVIGMRTVMDGIQIRPVQTDLSPFPCWFSAGQFETPGKEI